MSDDLSALPDLPLGSYRHYKGGEYEVIGVARHSEDLSPQVVYRPLYNASGWWVRPHGMFVETVEVDGQRQPRFAPLNGGDDLLATLQALEAELHHPGSGGCDEARLDALLHPDFHEVGRSGVPYDRATVIRYLAHQTAPAPVQAWGYAVFPLGPGTALLTYRSAQRGDDGALHAPTHRSSVWRLDETGWRLFYHQGTPSAEGAG